MIRMVWWKLQLELMWELMWELRLELVMELMLWVGVWVHLIGVWRHRRHGVLEKRGVAQWLLPLLALPWVLLLLVLILHLRLG